MIKHCCTIDGCDSETCVFDIHKEPELATIDCVIAKQLHAHGLGRDNCDYWKTYNACNTCGQRLKDHVVDIQEEAQ